MSLDSIAQEAIAEAQDAMTKFEPFHSAHEAHSVLKEEEEELWLEIKVNQKKRNLEKMRAEAIQVAAMALRFVHDICDGGRGRV